MPRWRESFSAIECPQFQAGFQLGVDVLAKRIGLDLRQSCTSRLNACRDGKRGVNLIFRRKQERFDVVAAGQADDENYASRCGNDSVQSTPLGFTTAITGSMDPSQARIIA